MTIIGTCIVHVRHPIHASTHNWLKHNTITSIAIVTAHLYASRLYLAGVSGTGYSMDS